MGPSNKLSCEAGSFSCCLNLHRFSPPEVLKPYFPLLEPWVVQSVSVSRLSACKCGTIPSSRLHLAHLVLQPLPFCKSFLPSCPSLPLLWVWINVSSLTPWLSDFHSARFSVSSDCFLFLNLLLSFFWLCKEAQCMYLCLHLGQKSDIYGVLNDI